MVKIHVDKVIDELYVLRIDDSNTKYFETLWYIPEGITYNAYLLLSDKIVLFDTWKYTYSEEFVENLSKIIDLKDIDFIVLHHMEQDHSGSLPKILELNNYKAMVLAHPLARGMMESFYGIKPKFKPIKDGEVLNVGKYSLKFLHTPWLHWPETMVTYIKELSVLLTCDIFGSFSIPPALYDSEVDKKGMEKYLAYTKKYVITVVGHYKDYIIKNIDKILSQGLDIKIIAPAHGLIWKHSPELIMNKYIEWAKGKPAERKVTIVYDSMYGYVEKAIKLLVDELSKNNIEVKTYAFNEKSRPHVSDILSDIVDSSALVIGVSTYEADVFPEIMNVVNLIAKKASYDKPVAVISVYGWGGVAGKKVSELLIKAKYKIINVLEFKGLAKADTMKEIKNLAKNLIKEIG